MTKRDAQEAIEAHLLREEAQRTLKIQPQVMMEQQQGQEGAALVLEAFHGLLSRYELVASHYL